MTGGIEVDPDVVRRLVVGQRRSACLGVPAGDLKVIHRQVHVGHPPHRPVIQGRAAPAGGGQRGMDHGKKRPARPGVALTRVGRITAAGAAAR